MQRTQAEGGMLGREHSGAPRTVDGIDEGPCSLPNYASARRKCTAGTLNRAPISMLSMHCIYRFTAHENFPNEGDNRDTR
jgi:hypothetical protein